MEQVIFEESEHQELLYTNVDLTKPLNLHIPSALGPLGYYVYVRVDRVFVDRLSRVSVSAKLNGLRDTDASVTAGDIQTFPADEEHLWVLLCRVPMARGDGEFVFENLPEGLTTGDVLFCTWLRFMETGEAEKMLHGQRDPLWTLSGVPMGGIGTGRVDVCRDGRFRNFSGNNNQDMPFEEVDGLAGAYLSVSAEGEERLLASRPMSGIAPCGELLFDPAFPQATLTAPNILASITAKVTFTAPVIPHDLKTSSIPAAVLRWTVCNNGTKAKEVTVKMAWPNLVGQGGGVKDEEKSIGYGDGFYRFFAAPDATKAETISIAGAEGLIFSNDPSPVCAAADGKHYLVAKDGVADASSKTVSVSLTVAPGAEATADMVLLWEMPNWIDNRQINRGLYWLNHFADGPAMIKTLLADVEDLFTKTGSLCELFAQTTVDADVQRRLLNCCYPLVTNSVLYKDGRFSINEGPTEMSGCYGTIDQRLAAHPATQLFFPQLNETELGLFAAVQDEDGAINHDLGAGNLEKPARPIQWPDLTCSFVIQNARHAWTTGDTAFARRAWPQVKKAIEKHGMWADAGNGVAQLGELGTSYDSYHYIGTTAYMGTIWIAALNVARKWAVEENDAELIQKIDQWIPAAQERLDTDLWNGSFYRAYASPGNPTNENSHAGMLVGQVYSSMLTGEDVLSRERMLSCVDAMMRLNCADELVVPADEAAPEGGAGSLYGWLPYIEAFCIAAAAHFGHEKVSKVWKKMIAVMQGENNAHPCDTRLMYRPQTGALSWGAYYMTAPASWIVYDALMDFTMRPAEKTLRFHPKEDGRFALVHPCFWGIGTRSGDQYTVEITAVFGVDKVEISRLEIPSSESYTIREIHPAVLTQGSLLTWSMEK